MTKTVSLGTFPKSLVLDGPRKCYDTLLEAIGDAEIVCIGEASHGSTEFYYERARITQRLISEKGFNVYCKVMLVYL
jgi:erythromycin esterase-like protein